jgi:hypothetical protein
MPNRDGTGPEGRGPLTGRGRGDCCPQGLGRAIGRGRRFQGGFGQGFGQGRGQGFGRGRGFQNFSQPVELTKKEKLEILKAELQEISEEKKAIEKELKNLK